MFGCVDGWTRYSECDAAVRKAGVEVWRQELSCGSRGFCRCRRLNSKRCLFGEASVEKLQKYEDSRRCLLGVEALLEKLQKYAVESCWLLCDEALVERSQQLKGTARPSKAGLALKKSGRGAFSTWAAFILTRVQPDTSRTSVLNAVTEPPTSRSRVSKVRDSLLPRSASPRPLPDALFHKTKSTLTFRHVGT